MFHRRKKGKNNSRPPAPYFGKKDDKPMFLYGALLSILFNHQVSFALKPENMSFEHPVITHMNL